MKNILKNWKTTSSGLLLIAGGVARAYFAYQTGTINEEAIMTSTTSIVSGVGLIMAKDSNVTGGTVVQDGNQK
jgi:hypothetical protein